MFLFLFLFFLADISFTDCFSYLPFHRDWLAFLKIKFDLIFFPASFAISILSGSLQSVGCCCCCGACACLLPAPAAVGPWPQLCPWGLFPLCGLAASQAGTALAGACHQLVFSCNRLWYQCCYLKTFLASAAFSLFLHTKVWLPLTIL